MSKKKVTKMTQSKKEGLFAEGQRQARGGNRRRGQ